MCLTVPPITWATPSQTAVTARPTPIPSSVSGPGPVRRGRAVVRERDFFVDERDFDAVDRRAWLPDDRDRELLELRDRGGEDVRVAMIRGYAKTPRVPGVTRRPGAVSYRALC
jgi:hypothetical protein